MTQTRITSGWFQYNGVRSDSMGIKVESRNVFGAPKYDAEFIAVPGRDGELINPNRRFSNVQITYTVFVPALSMAEAHGEDDGGQGVALHRARQVSRAS